MGIPRHNAHMKIAKHLWDRARVVAILEGKSMTEFVEHALAHALAIRQGQEDSDDADEGISREADR